MADISREIQAFRNAIYGKEVRGSMISLAEKVNKESTDAKTASAQSAESAAASIQLANIAVGRADTAAENADAAAQNIQGRADRGDFTSTVQIGSVTTGAAGTEASVSNSGTDKDVVLNLTIPRGDKGVSMYMAGAWNSGTEYVNSVSRIDIVTCNGSTYGCRQSHTSSQDNAPAGEENEYWLCLARKGDTGTIENIDTIPIAFSEAAEPENLESGDSVTTVFGKIKKWFSDLSNGAASTLLGNNLQEGKVLVSDETGKVSVSEVTQKQLEDRPNAFQSSMTIPVTSGWLKIAKLPQDAMLRTDIPDSETLAVSFSCTPTADTGDYDQACRFVITETWAGSKVRVLSSSHAGDAVVTQVRKVSDDTDQMYYLELEVNVPSCPCKLDVSFESGVIPWEPVESIQFDTGGGVNEIYVYSIREDNISNLQGIVNQYNDYDSVPVSELPFTNILTVSPEAKGVITQKKYVILQNDSEGFLTDMPAPLQNITSIVYRDVFYHKLSVYTSILIVLSESYPVSGRIWTNFYDNGVWRGWKCVTPDNRDLLFSGNAYYKENGTYTLLNSVASYKYVEITYYVQSYTGEKPETSWYLEKVPVIGAVVKRNLKGEQAGYESRLGITIEASTMYTNYFYRRKVDNNTFDTTYAQLHITKIEGVNL